MPKGCFDPFVTRSNIRQSRDLEWSGQGVKDDFHLSRFLIPVANISMGDMYFLKHPGIRAPSAHRSY